MFHFIRQALRQSLKSLLANKMRSFLTMLGIVIGIGSVIIIVSVGSGAQSLIVNQVKSLGTDLIGVLPGQSEENGPPASAMGIVITTLTYEDALALREKKNVPNIKEVVAYSKAVGTVSWEGNGYDTNLSGTMASYLDVEGGEVEQGRFFSREEEKSLVKVAVLGSTVKKEVFGESDAVGRTVKVKNQYYEVVGVMKERGTVAFQDYDDQIFIPIKTVQKLILGVNHISFLRAKVDNEVNIDKALNDVSITLRERHNIDDSSGAKDDFSARSAAQALDIINTITDGLKFFLAAMAAISLIVGGIGIMNIMLITVTERTREIGLRKALGATNTNIRSQFLFESISITFYGGVVGIISGIIISYLVAVVANKLNYAWDFVVTPLSVFTAFTIATLVGVIFGLYPARKAARLEPVEALRYE